MAFAQTRLCARAAIGGEAPCHLSRVSDGYRSGQVSGGYEDPGEGVEAMAIHGEPPSNARRGPVALPPRGATLRVPAAQENMIDGGARVHATSPCAIALAPPFGDTA